MKNLPKNWRQLSDTELEALVLRFAHDEDRTMMIHDELDTRRAIRTNPRDAEMLGAPWLEPS